MARELDPFPQGWYLAALGSDLAPGAVLPLKALGRELVLWRDEAGAAHLFDAYCAHLGAHLGHGGRVVGDTLRCPFHAWRYDGTGQCVEIPYAHRGLGRAKVGSYEVLERNGMVLWWWDRDGNPPRWDIPRIPEWGDANWCAGFQRFQVWQVRTQWREVAENGVDLTHFHYLHGVAELPDLGSVSSQGAVWRSTVLHTFESPKGRRPGRFDLEFHGPGVGWQRFVIDDVAEVLFTINITPIDEHSVWLRFGFLMPEGNENQRLLNDKLVDEIIRQVSDDVLIWDNKIVKDPPMLARGDGPIAAFRRWSTQFTTEVSASGTTDVGVTASTVPA